MILNRSTLRTPSPLMGEGWDGGDQEDAVSLVSNQNRYDMIRSAKVKLTTIFHRFSGSKLRDWLMGLLFLGISLYLLHTYAKGQWKHTIQFLKSWIAQL
jgi:hypothetical protein